MSLSKEKVDDIHRKKSISYLSQLLLGINDQEPLCHKQFANGNNTSKFNFKKSFTMFTDIPAYRHISIVGLVKDFNRNTSYMPFSLTMLLDVWYNNNIRYTKDTLRKPDILILFGSTDYKFGDRKAEALHDLIIDRQSYNKYTWLFLTDTDFEEFEKYQPGVLDLLGPVYQLNLKGKKDLGKLLSRAKQIGNKPELYETVVDNTGICETVIDNTAENTTNDVHVV